MEQRSAQLLREQGLRNLGSAKRWVTAGTAALALVLSAMAARALPGTSSHRSGGANAGNGAGGPVAPSQTGAGDGGLQSPSTAPAPAPQATPSVVSGGS